MGFRVRLSNLRTINTQHEVVVVGTLELTACSVPGKISVKTRGDNQLYTITSLCRQYTDETARCRNMLAKSNAEIISCDIIYVGKLIHRAYTWLAVCIDKRGALSTRLAICSLVTICLYTWLYDERFHIAFKSCYVEPFIIHLCV